MTGDNVPNKKKDIRVKVWGCLAENAVEWIAVESLRPDGTHELTTFLDEGFYDDWDSSPRLIEDCGCLRPQDRRLARKTGRRTRSNGRRGVRRADRSATFYLHARL